MRLRGTGHTIAAPMRQLRLGLAQINPTVGDLDGNFAHAVVDARRAPATRRRRSGLPGAGVTGYPPEDLLLSRRSSSARSSAPCERSPRAPRASPPSSASSTATSTSTTPPRCSHDGAVAGHLPQAVPAELRRLRREALLPGRARSNPVFVLRRHRVGVNICEDIWYPGGPARGRRRWRRRRGRSSTSTARPTTRASALQRRAHAGHARRRQPRDRRATSIWSAARTSSSSTAAAWSSTSRARCVAEGAACSRRTCSSSTSTSSACSARACTTRGCARAARCEAAIDAAVRPSHRARRARRRGRRTRSPRRWRSRPRWRRRSSRWPRSTRRSCSARATTCDKNGFETRARPLRRHRLGARRVHRRRRARRPRTWSASRCPRATRPRASTDDARGARREPRHRASTIIPIETVFDGLLDDAGAAVRRARSPDIAEENIQARIRGNILMALSNKFGWLVLTTGNKSEMAVGYATLYGDMAGGFAVIKDVLQDAGLPARRYRNERAGAALIPEARHRRSRRPPSCGPTRPTRTRCRRTRCSTRSSRPTSRRTAASSEIVALGYDRALVRRVIRHGRPQRVQAPPGARPASRSRRAPSAATAACRSRTAGASDTRGRVGRALLRDPADCFYIRKTDQTPPVSVRMMLPFSTRNVYAPELPNMYSVSVPSPSASSIRIFFPPHGTARPIRPSR